MEKRYNSKLVYGLDAVIALIPLVAFGIFAYGTRVLLVSALTVASAVASEFAIAKIMKKQSDITSFSSVVLGLLAALLLPPTVNYAVAVLVGILASAVKYILNIYSPVRINPSVAAVGIIYAFAYTKTAKYLPFGSGIGIADALDSVIVTETEDVASLTSGLMPDTSLWSMLFGTRPNVIGGGCIVLIAVIFIWLAGRKQKSAAVCLSYVATVFVYFYLYPEVAIETDIIALQYALYRVFTCQTVLLAALYASSPAECPKNGTARIAAGIIAGLVTVFGSKYISWDAVGILAVLAVNIISPALDMLFTKRNVFGGYIKQNKKKAAPPSDKTVTQP